MEDPADFHEEGRRWARVEPPAAFLASVPARLRDEAHRFAPRLSRLARLRSEIEEIPGIGPARQTELLRHFGPLKPVRQAGMEELSVVPGLGRSWRGGSMSLCTRRKIQIKIMGSVHPT